MGGGVTNIKYYEKAGWGGALCTAYTAAVALLRSWPAQIELR